MGIRAITFDFWNTLFTEVPGAFRLYQKRRLLLLAEAVRTSGEFTAEQLEQAGLLEAEAHNRIWREEHRTPSTAERLGKILEALEICLPESVTIPLVRAYEEGVLDHPPVLVPGAREVVDGLMGRYRLGIISDVGYSPGRVLKQVLEQAGVLGAFDSLVFSDEAGRSKPHLDVFGRTARALEVEHSEIVHIGDLEHTDILGAKRAGCYAIRFTGVTPMGRGEITIADRVTSEFSEIPQLIEALARAE